MTMSTAKTMGSEEAAEAERIYGRRGSLSVLYQKEMAETRLFQLENHNG